MSFTVQAPEVPRPLYLPHKIRALLDNRYNVSFSDVKSVARPSLRHRIILNFEGQAEGIRTDDIIDQILLEILE
jgi:MoxR-like ATPase